MARTPSMIAADVEQGLGPRGELTVDTSNRSLVRKWLTARGCRAVAAAALSNAELAAIYNNTNDNLFENLLTCRQPITVAPPVAHPTAAPPTAAPPVAHPTAAPPTAAPPVAHPSQASALEEIIRNIAGGAVDETRVTALINEALVAFRSTLPEYTTTRLEVSHPNGVTVDMGNAPRHYLLEQVIRASAAHVPVMLVGPAGSGKTTAAEQAAHALNLPFYLNGAVSGTHEYLGYNDAMGVYHVTPFRQAFEFGGYYCADELDAGDPAAILVINSALANGCMPFPDRAAPVQKHADFRLCACTNTYGLGADRVYVGRNQLDGATLDRFAKIDWPYDENLEIALSTNQPWRTYVHSVRRAVAQEHARVIVSTRAIVHGERLLAAGIPEKTVKELTIWNGVPSDQRKRIEAHVS